MSMMTAEPNTAVPEVTTPLAAKTLRPVLFTVFSLKLVVAALLIACATVAPPLSAESPYDAGMPAVAVVD